MTTSRRFLVATAALVAAVAVVTGVTVASAAHLDVSAGQISTATVTHPCPGTAAAEIPTQYGNYAYAVDLALPAGCANRSVQFVMTGQGLSFNGTGTTNSAGELRFDVGWYDVRRTYAFRATVDGWPLPVAWADELSPYIWCTVIDGSGATCTASLTVRSGYYDVVVATTSNEPVTWQVGFDLDHPVYGGVPARLGNSDIDGYNDGVTRWARQQDDYEPRNDVTGGASCAARPLLTVQGINSFHASHPENNFRTVVAGMDRQFSLRVGSTNSDYWDILYC